MSPDRAFKDAVYEQLARTGRALAHPRRLELLDLLCQGPMTVEQLARKSSLAIGSTSQHLQHLKAARLVQSERRGSYVVYRVPDHTTCLLLRTLQAVAERYNAEFRALAADFFGGDGREEPLDAAGLARRLAHEDAVVLDVRPADEYAAGHWPGALSIPLEALAERLAELPQDRTIVAYCRGPYCVLSLHALDLLRHAGLRAARLTEGMSDWRAQNVPLEEGARAGDGAATNDG